MSHLPLSTSSTLPPSSFITQPLQKAKPGRKRKNPSTTVKEEKEKEKEKELRPKKPRKPRESKKQKQNQAVPTGTSSSSSSLSSTSSSSTTPQPDLVLSSNQHVKPPPKRTRKSKYNKLDPQAALEEERKWSEIRFKIYQTTLFSLTQLASELDHPQPGQFASQLERAILVHAFQSGMQRRSTADPLELQCEAGVDPNSLETWRSSFEYRKKSVQLIFNMTKNGKKMIQKYGFDPTALCALGDTEWSEGTDIEKKWKNQETKATKYKALMDAHEKDDKAFIWSIMDGQGVSFIRCRECGGEDVDHYAKQTRSADEPMTVFFRCKGRKADGQLCGAKWRI